MKKLILFLLSGMLCTGSFSQKAKHSFSVGDSAFLLDGKPFQMISGEIHYTRVPREAWRQRMQMAKAMGLNTIGTYVFWNVHEPQKNVFDFKGNNDIAAFIKIAQEEGLWVVLRPSPYVCAEWEFGVILTGCRMKKDWLYVAQRHNILLSIRNISKKWENR